MPSSEEFRAKAQGCLEAASTTTDIVTRTLLRMLADDYLALAQSDKPEPVVLQQQQIQPNEPKTDKT
jgi:hypothetical protein